eukprot:m.369213 g.369213  ORF g.369213 m.369213 type:complete len:67 (-) comp48542_c0_seq1:1146-1346(-)
MAEFTCQQAASDFVASLPPFMLFDDLVDAVEENDDLASSLQRMFLSTDSVLDNMSLLFPVSCRCTW